MKILMIARPNLFTYPGGDTTQVVNTAKALEKIGVECDINPVHYDYAKYDLVHFFNIIDPEDILGHLKHLKSPYVVSTIYCIYDEYDRYHRSRWSSFLYRFISRNGMEYLKTTAKWLIKGENLSSYEFLWRGHKRSIQKILRGAACLLPNSENEYRRLLNDMGVEREYVVVPKGVNLNFFKPAPSQDRSSILCVGRIEGCKNQLNLIKALEETNIPLYLVGQPAKNQQAYYQKCKTTAGSQVHFPGFVSQEKLINYYSNARVHVLPSWFETTGLTSLEAAIMGCNIVVSNRGDVRDYFGNDAFYCDPGNTTSIREAILKAYHAPFNPKLADRIRKTYNWKTAAQKTLEGYQLALGKNKSAKRK